MEVSEVRGISCAGDRNVVDNIRSSRSSETPTKNTPISGPVGGRPYIVPCHGKIAKVTNIPGGRYVAIIDSVNSRSLITTTPHGSSVVRI